MKVNVRPKIEDFSKLHAFFDYAKERYKTKLNKESGKSKPWTEDPILLRYRFCNVHREDDTVTKWIRNEITFDRYEEQLLGAMIIARWFNRIETLELIRGLGPRDNTFEDLFFFNSALGIEAWEQKIKMALRNVKPLVTGAYMIKTPSSMNKLDGLVFYLKQILPDTIELQKKFSKDQEWNSLEAATEVLSKYPGLGSFMAYEVVTDLRHTPILSDAKDINTWANPGPGATRGVCRILGVSLDALQRTRPDDVEDMMHLMREILAYSKNPDFWPKNWPQWEMREVEHTLCEFDKYERVRLGEGRPKQLYDGIGGSVVYKTESKPRTYKKRQKRLDEIPEPKKVKSFLGFTFIGRNK